jgi:hypothetical protein
MVTKRIELPADLDEAIRAAAERSGQPEHEFIVNALRGQVRSLGNGAPGDITGDTAPDTDMAHGSTHEWRVEDLESLGVAADPELSGADVKDWLKANWRPR